LDRHAAEAYGRWLKSREPPAAKDEALDYLENEGHLAARSIRSAFNAP
jgi:hypothetical protein